MGAFFSDQERIDLGIVCPGTALFNLSNYSLELQKWELEVTQDPSPLRGTLGSSLRSPAEGEGNEGFPPPPDKDLESPSSRRLDFSL